MSFTVVPYDDLETFNFKEGDVIIHQTNCFNSLDPKIKRVFPLVDRDNNATRKGIDIKQGTFIRTKEKKKSIITLYTSFYIEELPSLAYFKESFTTVIPYIKINKLITDRLLILIPPVLNEVATNEFKAACLDITNRLLPSVNVSVLVKVKES